MHWTEADRVAGVDGLGDEEIEMPSVCIPVASGQRPTDTEALQPIYQFFYLSWLQLIKCEHLNIHHGFSVTASPPVKFGLSFPFLHEGEPAPWLNQGDFLLRKSQRVRPEMGSGWSGLDNNYRFMSKWVARLVIPRPNEAGTCCRPLFWVPTVPVPSAGFGPP